MMKTLEKRMAAREGFTLVELIVVIAILAILAAVAYPVYTGYIARAHDAAALETLGSIATAAQGIGASKGTTVSEIKVAVSNGAVSNIEVSFKDTDVSPIKANDSDEFKLLLTGSATGSLNTLKIDGETYKYGAKWAPDTSGKGAWTGGTESSQITVS